MNLKAAEKMFYGQKLKCAFFIDSDKGTKFFHDLMRQKHRRNFIPAIVCSNGILSKSMDDMGGEFVRYYKNILGSSKPINSVDISVVHSGRCQDSTAASSLLAPVTKDDIKLSLFSIGNDKAPGPDGFSSLFFTKSWSTIGDDFCMAIQDFSLFW